MKTAKCFHFGQKTGKSLGLRSGNECNYGHSRDDMCSCELPSSKDLPFFEETNAEHDIFYCGCRGWD